MISSEAPVLFDVGGHTGTYTNSFLSSFPKGHSYIFEPSANHLEVINDKYRDHAGVRIFPIGLGAEVGKRTLYKNEDVSALASLTKRRLDHFGINMDVTEIVDISTVDTIISSTSVRNVDLMKIDVEGHELDVMRGAVNAMKSGAVKMVQFEFGGGNLDTRTNLQDFFYLFKSYNLAIAIVQPRGRIHVLDSYDEMYEQYRTTNFVGAPKAVLNRAGRH